MAKFVFLTPLENPILALQAFDDKYPMQWTLSSNRRVYVVSYQCSIYMHWEDISFISRWMDTPGDAIKDALEEAGKVYDY